MCSGSCSFAEVCSLKSGTSSSGMASGNCDCEETFLGRGYGVAEVEMGDKCRASRVGEALAELDVEEDIVLLL